VGGPQCKGRAASITSRPARRGLDTGSEAGGTVRGVSSPVPAEPPARATLAALSLLALALALVVARVPLESLPHVTDEIAYTLQARLFASGLRTGPPGDNAGMLMLSFWVTEPASYSVFPPGWPMLLALGEVLGLPWLVNPLLAAALPPLTWRLARHFGSPRMALLSAAAMALSPGVLLMAGSRMAHTSVLVALLAATVLVLEPPRGWRLWLAGALVGYVVTARPFDAVLIGAPLILLGLHRGRTQALGMVLLPGLAAALVLWDNHSLTGDALTFPVGPWFDSWVAGEGRPPGCNRLGFGEDVGCSPTLGTWGHSPAKALGIAWASFLRLDRLLLGVPGSSLVLLPGLWALRRRPEVLLPIPLLVLGYALYWSPGGAYGARFWHPMYLALPLIVGASLELALRRWAWVPLALVPVAAGSFILRDLANSYWCVDGSLVSLLEERGVDEGVVFLRGTGQAELRSWPTVGMTEPFTCGELLEAGDGFLLLDPTRSTGGLQPRHALPTLEMTQAYMKALHPGETAWMSTVDLATGERDLVPIPLD
jgi:hypothetical protein